MLKNLKTNKVIDMSFMFNNCSNLNNLDVSNFNTENVIDMKGIFDGCYKLNILDIKNFNKSNKKLQEDLLILQKEYNELKIKFEKVNNELKKFKNEEFIKKQSYDKENNNKDKNNNNNNKICSFSFTINKNELKFNNKGSVSYKKEDLYKSEIEELNNTIRELEDKIILLENNNNLNKDSINDFLSTV